MIHRNCYVRYTMNLNHVPVSESAISTSTGREDLEICDDMSSRILNIRRENTQISGSTIESSSNVKEMLSETRDPNGMVTRLFKEFVETSSGNFTSQKSTSVKSDQ